MIKRILRVQEAALCLVRKWWRPILSCGIAGSVVTNGVVVPILTKTVPDLAGLAALVVAASPFAIMRGVEKMKGAE